MIIKCDICDCDEGIVRLVGYEIGIDGELFIDALSYCELCWKCKLAIQNTIKDTIKNLLQHQLFFLYDRPIVVHKFFRKDF